MPLTSNQVPGPPASVLAAILAGGLTPGQTNRATFSTVNDPLLPSLVSDVVPMAVNAQLDANVEVTGTLVFNGWATQRVTAVTSAYIPLPADAVILCDATAGAFTVTLPDATQAGYSPGQRYTIKKTDSTANAVTITGSAGQLIDNASSATLTAANSETSLVFDGSTTNNWWVWSGITALSIGAIGGVTFSGTPVASQVPVATSSTTAKWAFPGLQPSGDTTGATDTAAIQALINLGNVTIKLATGKFYLNKPLVIQANGIRLVGSGGATASGNDASLDLGTTLVLTSTFTNPNSWASLVTGGIVVIQKNAGAGTGGANPGSNQVSGAHITDLWIDGTNSPAEINAPGSLTVTPTGTTGATTYGYRVSALTAFGESLACTEVTTTTGNATLSGSNYNALLWSAVTGAASYNVYGRTAGGELKLTNVGTTSYNDTGAASPSGALPLFNSTGVDGVACYGAIEAFQMERVGAYQVTGKAFPQYLDPSWSSGAFPDGQHCYSMVAQKCHDHAFYGSYVDATLIDCHAQSSNLTGAGYGDGFYLNGGGNNRLISCRSDLNANGFTMDNARTVGSNSYFDSISMVGCGTQGNNQNGLNVINTSSNGTNNRVPVILSGCSFDGDGQDSGNGASGGAGYAAIHVEGKNDVWGSSVAVLQATVWATSGSPQYAISTAAVGTTPGVPSTILIDSGFLNPVTAIFHDTAPAHVLSFGPNVQAYVGGEYNGPGVAPLVKPYSAQMNGLSLDLEGAGGINFADMLHVVNTTSAPGQPPVVFEGVASTDRLLAMRVTGDTVNRLAINPGGQIAWGPGGSSNRDVALQRASAGLLSITDNANGGSAGLKIAASSSQVGTTSLFQAICNASGDVAYMAEVNGDSNTRYRLDSNGLIKWGTGAATQDVALQRGATGQLQLSTTSAAGTFKSLDPYFGGRGFLEETSALSLGNAPRAAYTQTTAGLTTSGTIYLVAVYIACGTPVTNISFLTGTGTLKTGGTHGWYVLVDNNGVIRAVSADQTDAATTWGTASTVYTLPVLTSTSSVYTTTYSGIWRLGIMVANSGGTQPNLVATAATAAGVSSTIGPALAGPCTGGTGTSQTTPPAADGTVTLTVGSDGSKNFIAWVT